MCGHRKRILIYKKKERKEKGIDYKMYHQLSRKVVQSPVLNLSRGVQGKSGKPRIAIIGAGWAGYRVAQDLDKSKFEVEVISPRNHFLFTPLLPSTTVGTLEFRAIQEPVRTIPNVIYHQANVNSIDFESSKLHCSDALDNGYDFELSYDGLILAPGSETNTLGVTGVTQNPNVFFLKQLSHSRAIRNKLLECFERASSPAVTNDVDRKELLTFIVVGGGPTSIEFASELYDFLQDDVSRWYPDLYPLAKVKIVEASGHILGSFNSGLVSYVEKLFSSRHIDVLTGTVVSKIEDNVAHLSDGTNVKFGLAVWSTGIKQVPLVELLPDSIVAKHARGRLRVDAHLRLLGPSAPVGSGNIFAMGDCAGDSVKPLPALAQVASQQGIYLAKLLNEYGLDVVRRFNADLPPPSPSSSAKAIPPFRYQHFGSMASVGEWKGVFDSPSFDAGDSHYQAPPVQGLLAFLLWRSAYWTKQVSLVNKVLIPMYWFKCMLFGRDISRF
jgi:NADH dehydrogenase/NADH:ubiquinone reductase (non-electrogenic)